MTMNTKGNKAIKGFCVDNSHLSVDFGSISSRTRQILQYLMDNAGPQNCVFMARILNQPYNSVQKTLSRLVRKGLVKKCVRGFYELNHDVLSKIDTFTPYALADVGVCEGGGKFDRNVLKVHRLGIGACVDRLFSRLLETSNLVPFDLKNIGVCYHARSRRFDANVNLYPSGRVYYQRSCAPIPLRSLPLLYEDLVDSVCFFTKGLGELSGVTLHDFELGLDLPLPDGCEDLFSDVSRFEIYRKKKKARVHVQFSKDLPLPLDSKAERDLAKEWLDKTDGLVRLLQSAQARVSKKHHLPNHLEEKIAEMSQAFNIIRHIISEEEFQRLQWEKLHEETRGGDLLRI